MDLSKADKSWQRFNKKLQEQMKTSDWFGLGTTYYEMATFIEKEGKESEHLRKQGYQMKLRHNNLSLQQLAASDVVKTVTIHAEPSTSCAKCKAISGKVIPLEEALKSNVLPVEDCGFKPYGCRCVYLPNV